MKHTHLIWVSLLLFVFVTPSVADETNFEFTVENLYDHFAKNYTVKEFFLEAKEQATWLAEECKKGEEACKQGLAEFGKPYSGWNDIRGFKTFTDIVEMNTGTILVHPNPKLQKVVNVPGLDQRYKDHRGMLIMLDGFNKLREHGEWGWFAQYTTWMRSETQLKEPLFTLNVIVVVPGTPYQVHHVMPYRAESTEDIEAKITLIEEQSKNW